LELIRPPFTASKNGGANISGNMLKWLVKRNALQAVKQIEQAETQLEQALYSK
jgi:hypothetical protein